MIEVVIWVSGFLTGFGICMVVISKGREWISNGRI